METRLGHHPRARAPLAGPCLPLSARLSRSSPPSFPRLLSPSFSPALSQARRAIAKTKLKHEREARQLVEDHRREADAHKLRHDTLLHKLKVQQRTITETRRLQEREQMQLRREQEAKSATMMESRFRGAHARHQARCRPRC